MTNPSTPTSTTAERREWFAGNRADSLADLTGADQTARQTPGHGRSARFVHYSDPVSLTLVVGDQEGGDVDLALAFGLGLRGDRLLRLVLPRGWHEPTLHRWAWLRDDLRLEVWTHGQHETRPETRPTRDETTQVVEGGEDPHLHLRDRTDWVARLMRWAGHHPDLDASHRRDVRAWQCRGQRVLSLTRTKSGVGVVAGIAWGATASHAPALEVDLTGPLDRAEEEQLRSAVEQGIEQRLAGVAHKADEHWLQAVLRRHPRSLGLEQPVLRELPAWRPSGSRGTKQNLPRGRGFVDLAGLDSSGNLVLVETKLGGDHMLVLQGLDYRIWAEANRQRLTERLDCRTDTPMEIAYCVGGKNGGTPAWSAHAAHQLNALAPDLRWHVQEVTGWTDDGPQAVRGDLHVIPARR